MTCSSLSRRLSSRDTLWLCGWRDPVLTASTHPLLTQATAGASGLTQARCARCEPLWRAPGQEKTLTFDKNTHGGPRHLCSSLSWLQCPP